MSVQSEFRINLATSNVYTKEFNPECQKIFIARAKDRGNKQFLSSAFVEMLFNRPMTRDNHSRTYNHAILKQNAINSYSYKSSKA